MIHSQWVAPCPLALRPSLRLNKRVSFCAKQARERERETGQKSVAEGQAGSGPN